MSGPQEFSAGGAAPSIREARPDDATEACDLIRASIVELCFEDHEGDRGKLAVWLANKTPDNLRSWIAQSHVFIAERDGRMSGVGALTSDGRVTLNYVLPKERFSGISKALLLGMEERARDLGLRLLVLEPTLTAMRFYLDAGFEPSEARGRKLVLTKRLD